MRPNSLPSAMMRSGNLQAYSLVSCRLKFGLLKYLPMKIILFIAALQFSISATATTYSLSDWSQPPLGCIEEMIPKLPSRNCLDLSSVLDPMQEWPAMIDPLEKDYWYTHRRELSYCRASEVQRREQAQPGSQTPGYLQVSWMITEAPKHAQEKIDAIYEANQKYLIPPHVLTGAVFQESLFSELGISDDGGNFSCGAEQINLIGWCNWANQQSDQEKAAMGWPLQMINCNSASAVDLEWIRPFYKIALTRLNGLP